LSIINGNNVILTVNGELICCARSVALSTAADIGDTSTMLTGKWKTYKGLKLSFALNCSGLCSADMNMSIAALRRLQIALQPLDFIFSATDINNNNETYSGQGIVTAVDTPASYNSAWEYTMLATGTGELTIQTIPPSTANIWYGTQDTNADPTALGASIMGNPANNIVITYPDPLNIGKFYYMFYLPVSGVPVKTAWQDVNDPINSGGIGADGLFAARAIDIGGTGYIMYMTNYKTLFTGPLPKVKFYRP